ncbi:MAG: hypothetical protein RIS41_63 [Actinomycetota bacterium]
MLRVEFTVEPFVEGQPGRHVLAAVDAVRALGSEVDFGPFASSFEATDEVAAQALSALVAAAYANGATHVSLQVERVES